MSPTPSPQPPKGIPFNKAPHIIVSFSLGTLTPYFGRNPRSFAALSQHIESDRHSYLFNAASPHNILSFEHSVNYGGGKQEGLLIKMGFIDPTYEFEQRFTKQGSMYDFVKEKITDPNDAKIKFKVAFKDTYVGLQNDAKKAKWEEGGQDLEGNITLTGDEHTELKKKAAQAVMDLYNSKVENQFNMNNQLAIAYGIGEDLSTWAGPFLCQPSLITNKYDGTGTRILQIEAVPVESAFAAADDGKTIDDGFEKYGEGVSPVTIANFDTMGSFQSREIPELVDATMDVLPGMDVARALSYKQIPNSNFIGPYFSGFHQILTSLIRNFAHNFAGNIPPENIVLMFPDFNKVFSPNAEKILFSEEALMVKKFGAEWRTDQNEFYKDVTGGPLSNGVKVNYPDLFDTRLGVISDPNELKDTYVTLTTDLGRKVLEKLLAQMGCSLLYVNVSDRTIANAAASTKSLTPVLATDVLQSALGKSGEDVIIKLSTANSIDVDIANNTDFTPGKRNYGFLNEWDDKFTGIKLTPYVTELAYETPPGEDGGPPILDPQVEYDTQIDAQLTKNSAEYEEYKRHRYAGRLTAIKSLYGGSKGDKVWIAYRKGKTTETYTDSFTNFLKDIKSLAGETMPGELKMRWVTESDMLAVMRKHGIIGDASRPAMIVGIADLIDDFVFAKVKLKEEAFGIATLQDEIRSQINEADLKQFTDSYLTDMDEVIRPTLGRLGEFEELFIPDITLNHDDILQSIDQPKNINQFGSTPQSSKELKQVLKNMGIPIFRSGVMKSNILSIDLEMSPLYFSNLLQNFDYNSTSLGAGNTTTPTSPASLGINAGNSLSFVKAAQVISNQGFPMLSQGLAPPSPTAMISMMVDMVRAYQKKGPTNFINPKSNVTPVAIMQDLARRLMGMFMQGGIKTLPLFRLSGWKVLSRPCYVIVKEQRIHPSLASQPSTTFKSVLSQLYTGMWSIYGFRHVINTHDAYSQFTLIKTPLTPPAPKEKEYVQQTLAGVGQQQPGGPVATPLPPRLEDAIMLEPRIEMWVKKYGGSEESQALMLDYFEGHKLTEDQVKLLTQLMSTTSMSPNP